MAKRKTSARKPSAKPTRAPRTDKTHATKTGSTRRIKTGSTGSIRTGSTIRGTKTGSTARIKTGSTRSIKTGSTRRAAEAFGGRTDFGIPAAEALAPRDDGGRTKGPSKGTGPERSGMQGRRTVGVGTAVGPDGSGSGGDLDPDIVGVGGVAGGSGVAASGGKRIRKADQAITTGTSDERASKTAAEPRSTRTPGRQQGRPSKAAEGRIRPKGTTHTAATGATEDAGGTADAFGPEARSARRDEQTVNPLRGGPARKINVTE